MCIRDSAQADQQGCGRGAGRPAPRQDALFSAGGEMCIRDRGHLFLRQGDAGAAGDGVLIVRRKTDGLAVLQRHITR